MGKHSEAVIACVERLAAATDVSVVLLQAVPDGRQFRFDRRIAAPGVMDFVATVQRSQK